MSMRVKQLAITVQNASGQLARLTGHFNENCVRVIALYISSQESDKATICVVVSDPDLALSLLRSLGFEVVVTDVVAAQVPSHPGGLYAIFRTLGDNGVNIRQAYPAVEVGKPILILDVDAPEVAVKCLSDNWITLFGTSLYVI